jgi:signal transduction histidine kinase
VTGWFVGRWWTARSLRLRLTVVSAAVLAIGLGAGTLALASLFYHQRLDAVDDNNRVEIGSITALLSSDQLPDPLPTPAGRPVVAQVVDLHGVVRGATLSAGRVVPLVPLDVLRAHDGRGPFTSSQNDGTAGPDRVLVVSTRYRGEPMYVVSTVSYGDVGSALGALLRAVAVAVPIIVLAAALATWVAVGSALRPVDRLREAAERVVPDTRRQPARLPVPRGADELARLAGTLNAMLERLAAASAQQRSFVADAAHELRSPIASIQTQLEVALATAAGESEWRRAVSDVLQDVLRVGAVAEDMLLLARIDAGAPARRRVVDIGNLLDLEPPGVLVDGDPVAIRLHTDGGWAVVTVDDDGPGVPPHERERVFERWVRLDEARSQGAGGSGLGLSIARSVARSLGGDVTLDASPLGGLRATLTLPLSAGEDTEAGRQVYYGDAGTGSFSGGDTWG